MNPEYKAKWLKVLRAKENQNRQSHGQLRFDDDYCVVGMLCNVYNPNGWVSKNEKLEGEYWVYEYEGQESEHQLQSALAEELGISKADLEMLYNLNDNEGMPFSEIAKIIEEEL